MLSSLGISLSEKQGKLGKIHHYIAFPASADRSEVCVLTVVDGKTSIFNYMIITLMSQVMCFHVRYNILCVLCENIVFVCGGIFVFSEHITMSCVFFFFR